MTEYYVPGEQPLLPYEVKQALEIHHWKHQEPGLTSSAMGYLVDRAGWAVDKVTPGALKQYYENSTVIQNSIKGALDLANSGAKKITDSRDLLEEADVSSLEELRSLPLKRSDILADSVHNWAVALASAEGGLFGAVGLPGIVADVPALVTICFRTIHKIGLCYGYALEDEADTQTVYAILSAANAMSMEEKVAAFYVLGQFQKILIRESWTVMAKIAATKQLSNEGILIGLRTLLRQIGINLTKRKALQAIPLMGGMIGAAVNGYYVKDIGWAARRVFQERKLAEQGKIVKIFGPNEHDVRLPQPIDYVGSQ